MLILFVLKSNKSLKLCVDYRNLNTTTIKNRYLLSFIKKTLDCLIDNAYFTKLNLKKLIIKFEFVKTTNRKRSFEYNINTSSTQ